MSDIVYAESFEQRKLNLVKAAKELKYEDEVIEKIKEATTDEQLNRIMLNARKRKR